MDRAPPGAETVSLFSFPRDSKSIKNMKTYNIGQYLYTLAKKFRILVAGGFGNLKGKVFRVGCMGEVHRYHVMRTISGIASTLAMMGYDTDAQAGLKIAEEKLKPLDSL